MGDWFYTLVVIAVGLIVALLMFAVLGVVT